MYRPERYSEPGWDLICQAGELLRNSEGRLARDSRYRNHFSEAIFREEIDRSAPTLRSMEDVEPALWRAILSSIVVGRHTGIYNGEIYSIFKDLFIPGHTPFCDSAEEVQIMRSKTFDIRMIQGSMTNFQHFVPGPLDEPRTYRRFYGMEGRQHPGYFNHDDYSYLKQFLEETFGEVDPNLVGIVLRSLRQSLRDPNSIFMLIRKAGHLSAIGRVTRNSRHSPDFCEIGTMYTDRSRRGYGFGAFIERVLLDTVKDEQRFWARDAVAPVTYGSVSVYIPSIARHFHHSGVIGTGLGCLDDGVARSGPMIWLKKAEDHERFLALSDRAPSDEELDLLMSGMEMSQIGGVRYCQADTDPDNNTDFLCLLANGFERGEVLSRFFYPDPESRRAIFAFESSV